MLRLFCILILTGAAVFAQKSNEPARGGTKTRVLTQKSTKLPANMNEPPSSAQRITADTYRHTDAEGKKWIYKKTPFGWSKIEESQMPAPVKPEDDQTRVVEVAGDTIRFERPGPFGSFKWERNRAELNEIEKTALAKSEAAKK